MGEMLWVPTLPFLKLLGIRFAASQNYILLMVVILVIGGMVEVYYLEIWWLWIVEGMGLIVMIWAAGKTYYFCNKCGNAQEQLSIDHCFSTQGWFYYAQHFSNTSKYHFFNPPTSIFRELFSYRLLFCSNSSSPLLMSSSTLGLIIDGFSWYNLSNFSSVRH